MCKSIHAQIGREILCLLSSVKDGSDGKYFQILYAFNQALDLDAGFRHDHAPHSPEDAPGR